MSIETTEINQSGLTDKQERFAHEYLIDQNASAAALRAGYSSHSYRAQAGQLMQQPTVRKRIRALLEELYARIKLNAEQLMLERMRTAFFDPRRLFDAQSRPIPFKELDAECAGVMLVSYDTRANGEQVTRVRQPSRAAALSALERRFMQFLRMQQEDTITERENADLQLAVGRDPADLAKGGVVRFTRERGGPAGQAPQEEAAEQETAPVDDMTTGAGTAAEAAPVPPKRTAGPTRPAPSKVCVPTARAARRGRADAWGNIDAAPAFAGEDPCGADGY